MLNVRVIPVLLLQNGGLVKTVQFKNPKYVGDPINAVKIFNEKEVDELIILDISATQEKRGPRYDQIKEIASEAFMPIAYGGGITALDEIKTLIQNGVEKVVINTHAAFNLDLVRQAAALFGAQSIVVSVDIKKNVWGTYNAYTHNGTKKNATPLFDYIKQIEQAGAGELFINAIDKDGTYLGYDVALIKKITQLTNIPVIACGGAGKTSDFEQAVKDGGASAIAAGSLFVFHGPHKAVLINYPEQKVLTQLFS